MNIKVTVLTPGYIQTNIAQHALTKDGSPMAQASQNIDKGLSADKAARQILRAIARGAFEAYIGKLSGERVALVLNRLTPGVLMRMAPGLQPK